MDKLLKEVEKIFPEATNKGSVFCMLRKSYIKTYKSHIFIDNWQLYIKKDRYIYSLMCENYEICSTKVKSELLGVLKDINKMRI